MKPEDLAVEPSFSPFLNALGLQRRYGVILHLGTAAEPLKIHFEVAVSCTEVASKDVFRVLFQKQQIYINEKAPDSLLDIMSDEFGKVLYPLLVEIDKKGQFLRIANGDEIQKRWKDARPALSRYYIGDIANRGLAGMDRAVANETFLAETLRHEWLFALLCAPVYGTYQEHMKTAEMQLPMVPYKPPVKYALQLKTEPQRTESGFIKVAVTGSCADKRSAAEILKGAPVPLTEDGPAVGNVALEYKMYPHNGTLFSVTGEITLHLPAGEKQVEVELYQLNPRDFIPNAAQAATSVILEVEVAPKKSGWTSFFR